ncbi:hypothetical protein MKX01_041475 [Papaver californicum]|nr:hypothetical protein MKX01_041475 [Papaver californicum]
MTSTFRVFSRKFSAARAIVENVRLRPRLQHLSKQGKVLNKADVRRTMAKGSCVGTHPGNGEHNSSPKIKPKPFAVSSKCIARCDNDLLYFQLKYQKAPEGSVEETRSLQSYQNALQQRSYVDATMGLIGEFLFGTTEKAFGVMKAVRPDEQPLIDDCPRYRRMLDAYVKICGPFSLYGLKHTLSIANMCNVGVEPEDFAKAATYACCHGPPIKILARDIVLPLVRNLCSPNALEEWQNSIIYRNSWFEKTKSN